MTRVFKVDPTKDYCDNLLRSDTVQGKVTSLNNFKEGRESKIPSAKVNKTRDSMIFLYDISM